MNFIAGLCLLFIADEEDAFWTLATILEDVMPPGYYEDKMVGLIVDQRVVCALAAERLPAVSDGNERSCCIAPALQTDSV